MSKQQYLNVRLSLELKTKIQAMADEQGRSLSNMVNYILEQATKDKPKK